MSVLATLAAIGILALLILVHEAGHFAAARWQGIHVTRFSIGFGPVLWKHQGSLTEYALRLLPLGGYVGFPDDDEDSPFPPNDPDLLKNRPVLDRAIVLSAGVLANLLFAYIALLMMTTSVGILTTQVHAGIVIPQVLAATPAEQGGLRAGDVILQANQYDFRPVDSLPAAQTAIQHFQDLVKQGDPLELLVERHNYPQPLPLSVVPMPRMEGEGLMIGVNLDVNSESRFRPPTSIGEVFQEAARVYEQIVWLNVQGLSQLVMNFQHTAGQLSGPVGIVKIGAELAQSSAVRLYHFAALISINLAILNLLPLPALDGGHLAFLLLEALRGKRLPRHFEDRVMQTGLVFFLGLGVVLILKDTVTIALGAG